MRRPGLGVRGAGGTRAGIKGGAVSGGGRVQGWLSNVRRVDKWCRLLSTTRRHAQVQSDHDSKFNDE